MNSIKKSLNDISNNKYSIGNKKVIGFIVLIVLILIIYLWYNSTSNDSKNIYTKDKFDSPPVAIYSFNPSLNSPSFGPNIKFINSTTNAPLSNPPQSINYMTFDKTFFTEIQTPNLNTAYSTRNATIEVLFQYLGNDGVILSTIDSLNRDFHGSLLELQNGILYAGIAITNPTSGKTITSLNNNQKLITNNWYHFIMTITYQQPNSINFTITFNNQPTILTPIFYPSTIPDVLASQIIIGKSETNTLKVLSGGVSLNGISANIAYLNIYNYPLSSDQATQLFTNVSQIPSYSSVGSIMATSTSTTNTASGLTNTAIGLTNTAIGSTNTAIGSTNTSTGLTNTVIGSTGLTNTAIGSTVLTNTAIGSTGTSTTMMAGSTGTSTTMMGGSTSTSTTMMGGSTGTSTTMMTGSTGTSTTMMGGSTGTSTTMMTGSTGTSTTMMAGSTGTSTTMMAGSTGTSTTMMAGSTGTSTTIGPTSTASGPTNTASGTTTTRGITTTIPNIMGDIMDMFPKLSSDQLTSLINSGINISSLLGKDTAVSSNGIGLNRQFQGPSTNVVQTNLRGSSNIYSPYLYYNKGVSENNVPISILGPTPTPTPTSTRYSV